MSKQRKPFIGGNWKCNGTRSSVEELVKGLNANSKFPSSEIDVVVAPTFIHLDYVVRTLKKPFQVSAQNCSLTGNGAYTGEVSAPMLKDFDVHWVIIGHSERRQYYGESDKVVGAKVAFALKSGLKVIACIGETLDERKAGKTFEVVYRQIKAISENVNDWSRIVIAYEPVWAIGTGQTATPNQAEEVHAGLRSWLEQNVGRIISQNTRFIYGGSVTAANADSLMQQHNIDGFLVGGASLKAADFITIFTAPTRTRSKL